METHEETKTMVETPRENRAARRDCLNRVNREGYRREERDEKLKNCHQSMLHKIRRAKKIHFWMNTGVVKFSTVHSFKGWEVHTLFLVVEGDFLDTDSVELAYTGLTRCINQLVVFNIGDDDVDRFFDRASEEIEIERFQI
jgi:superfamily I DNA/RNA helicase